MWIQNAWYVAAFSRDLEHALLPRTMLGKAVLLYRGRDGKPVAMADKCPHRGVPLSLGKLVDGMVRCTYHGLRIDSDGQCRHIPCQTLIPAQARVATYPVAEKYGFTWVWMGEAALADMALIPDVHWMDDPDWTACGGYHHVGADYQLMNDNLLDLSHESYLHDKTIGNEAVAEAPVKTTVNADAVRVHRDILNCEPPPFYVKATGFTDRINRWHTTIFTPPSFNLIENGSYPATAGRDQALERRVIHLTTPETATSCHYFWGVARAYQRDDTVLTEFIRQQSSNTFDEDKAMLEAQQRSLGDAAGSAFPVALCTDVGPIQARKLIQKRLAGEHAASV
ncbi:Rieske 2Fe-2S domain-containing protein [Polaromonas sp.]|uniref:aromatic ring-hydroxylating dioxygenase subunit alpha n=1 Tax=Polaromonas sp. TaxID=1869339 RepID=UPI003BAB96B8